MPTVDNINFTTPLSIQRWSEICALIGKKPMTAPEIARAIKTPPERANAFFRHYRHLVHICDWRQGRIAVWALGSAEDAPKPSMVKVGMQEARRAELVRRARGFKPQAVARDWSVAMVFGPAVNLNAELAGMRA